ncbi:MAG: hypothetical protein RLZZ546_3309 [Bacteroidota bacterium]|jgi:hypothetical protein
MKFFKSILSILLLIFAFQSFGQSNFNYQAVLRNTNGQLLKNQNVNVKISIIKGSANGTNIYSENQSLTTNENGLLNMTIGKGLNTSGSLENINLGSTDFFVKTEVDPNGGNNFTISGTSQLFAVPYALKAHTVDELPEIGLEDLKEVSFKSLKEGDMLKYDGFEWTNEPAGDLNLNLDGLNDVEISSPQLGDFLGYDGQKWKELPAVTPFNSELYSIPVWLGNNILGNSLIKQDFGKINVNNPPNTPGTLNCYSPGGYGIYGESGFIGVYGTGGIGLYGYGGSGDYGVVASGGGEAALRVDGRAIIRQNSSSPYIYMEAGNVSTTIASTADLYIGAGGGTVTINGGGGEVGIGTNNPNALFTVNGSASKTGGGSWATFSDARLKKNVQPYNLGLSQLLKINPVTYEYNEKSDQNTSKIYTGIIAQQLQEVVPSMVSESESANRDGQKYLMVDPSDFTYMTINAIKEQQKIIEQLSLELKEVKEELEKLKK